MLRKVVNDPNEVFDILNKQREGRFLSIGYVKKVDLLKSIDYNTICDKLKIERPNNENIVGCIGITMYIFPFKSENEIKGTYSEYANILKQLYSKYNIEIRTRKKKTDNSQSNRYSTSIEPDRTKKDFRQPNITIDNNNAKKYSFYCLVDDKGNIFDTIEYSKLVNYTKKKEVPHYNEVLNKYGNEVADKYKKEYREISSKYNVKTLSFNKILWISTTIDNNKIIYINDNLIQDINKYTNIDTKQLKDIAIEKYASYIETNESRIRNYVKSIVMEVINESLRKRNRYHTRRY